MKLRYEVRVGAFPVSIRDSVDGARPSRSATSSSLIDCDSRSRLNSLPSRRRRTVGPTDTALAPSEGSAPRLFEAKRIGCLAQAIEDDTRMAHLVRSHMKFHAGDLCHALA